MDNHKQIRAIKRYAHAMRMAPEMAAMDWVEHGLAKQWREYANRH